MYTNDIKTQKNYDLYDIKSFTDDKILIEKYNNQIKEIKKCKERNGKESAATVKYAILSRQWFVYSAIDLHNEFDIFMFIQNCDEMTYETWKNELIELHYIDMGLRVINFNKCIEFLVEKTNVKTDNEEE